MMIFGPCEGVVIIKDWQEAEKEVERTIKEMAEFPQQLDDVKYTGRQVNALVKLAMIKLGYSQWDAFDVCAEIQLFYESFTPDEILRRGLILNQISQWDPKLDHKWKKVEPTDLIS